MLKHKFEISNLYLGIISHVERIAIALGHIGLICLFCKLNILSWLKKSLSACRENGFYQLHYAKPDRNIYLLWFWIWIIWNYEQNRAIVGCSYYLDISVNCQSYLVKIFSVWPSGMGMAFAHILAAATNDC